MSVFEHSYGFLPPSTVLVSDDTMSLTRPKVMQDGDL